MQTALDALEERIADGTIDPATFKAVLAAFEKAGLSLALDGEPTFAQTGSILESLRDIDPDLIQ